MPEAASFWWSHRPDPNCYDSLPLSLFYLDVATSCNYIWEASDTQKCPFVWQDDAVGAKTKQPDHDDNYCGGSSHTPDRKWWEIWNEASLSRLDLAMKEGFILRPMRGSSC